MTSSGDDAADLRGVVAVGGSAGGVEALTRLAAGLPVDLPYAILVALHLPRDAPSMLAQIVDRAGPLRASTARNGERLRAGRIYVATPDRHLLVMDHRTLLSTGPTENGHRPALNAMFRSAAVTFGPQAVGVLLSGVLDDGVLGLTAIRSRGGRTVVQSPDDALFPTMPMNAVAAGVVDRHVSASAIGALLTEFADEPLDEVAKEPDPTMELENRIAMASRFDAKFDTEALGPPSGYTCPSCSGSLQEIDVGSYRCHVGHAWTAESLLSARDDEIETALWVAMRSLQEKGRLARRMADRASGALRRRYTDAAEEAERAVAVLAERLAGGEGGVD